MYLSFRDVTIYYGTGNQIGQDPVIDLEEHVGVKLSVQIVMDASSPTDSSLPRRWLKGEIRYRC